jgi:uncharacterized protein YdaU (DUF1376 family)
MCPFEALPYYRWHWRDYRANRKVQSMTYTERGLYRELLDECWAEGFIPDDLDALAEICGCPRDVLEGSWPKLRPCFTEASPGALINRRMDRERTEKDAERASKAVAGARGGSARAKAEAKQVLPVTEQVLSTCHIAVARALAEQEQQQEQESCAEPCGSTLPPAAVITLSLNDGSQFPISQEMLSEWISLFPAVQVMQELRNMRAWLDANPTRRKTKRGIKRFIVGWLSKEQDYPNPIPRRSTAYGPGTNTGSARTQRNRAALNAVKQRNQERFGSTEGPDRGDGDGNS